MGDVVIRVATDDDFAAIAELDGLAFGSAWNEEHLAAARTTIDLDRFRVADDRGNIVGVGGIYGQELTVPGRATVPAGGVTWVAVSPTHRRQGVLTAIMNELHRDIDAHGEPIAMLTASEGGIYERFGYGVATNWRVTEIDRRRAQVRSEFRPPPGSVTMTGLDDPALAGIFDRYRRQRVGEIDRTTEADALFRVMNPSGMAVARHADGFATWKLTANWNDGHPAHQMRLYDVVAITPEAHAALWHTVLSVDLVGPITSYGVLSLDDPLNYLVDDPRSIRTTNLNDMLWVHLRDVGRSLAARTYGTDDDFVIDVDLGERVERWRVAGGPDGATAKKARTRPALSMDRAALGAIYLGGVRPSTLARAGRLTAKNDSVLRRADAFFMADALPHCSTGF